MPEEQKFEQIENDTSEKSLDGEKDDREFEFQRKLARVRDDVCKKIDSSDLKTSKVFDILIDKPEQRKSIEYIYGIEEIAKLEEGINSLALEDKRELVDKIVERLTPVLKRYFFEPEIIARTQEIAAEEKIKSFNAGEIVGHIKNSPWEFTLGAGTDGEVKVTINDKIIELQWPENSRWGLQAIRESLKEVAKVLQDKPEIKAVVGVSWMMSHEGAGAFGFERFPDLKIEDEQRQGSFMVAIAGRKDKPYKIGKQLTPEDVMVGAMSREEFLHRYL